MLFNSYEFLFVFLPTVLLVVFVLHKYHQAKNKIRFLTIASLLFYSWWHPSLAWLLPLSIVINYYLGRKILSNSTYRKTLLTTGIVFNLSLLIFFKYTNFIIEIIMQISSLHFDLLNILLPLAISFITFQQIAYLYDCYKGTIKDINIWEYALFISFFPQLICGPIVHYREIVPQFKNNAFKSYLGEYVASAIVLFSIGIFKKTVIADNLAEYADKIYNAASSGAISTLDAWYGTFAFTFQIYFDFSGYTDMAMALALLFGVRLPKNFDSPYKAVNVYDLWQRWHISLSRFMRTHLFYPLSRNELLPVNAHIAIIITVITGGLWHGANWTFIIWGGMHALLLLINHYWRRINSGFSLVNMNNFPGTSLAIFITFMTGMFTRVAFRANDTGSMWGIYESMFSYHDVVMNVIDYQVTDIMIFVPIIFIVWFCPNSDEIVERLQKIIRSQNVSYHHLNKVLLSSRAIGVISTILLLTSVLLINKPVQFVYFKF